MESDDYRNIKQDLLEFSGGKRMLSVSEVCRYMGIVDRRTAHRRFPGGFDDNGEIHISKLARLMCEGGKRR